MTDAARPGAAAGAAVGGRVTEAMLERHFRQMLPDTGVVLLEELTGDVEVGCIDGRRSRCVTGAPGGSAGLLILLLASWEMEMGRELSPEAVESLFLRYLDHFGTFYVHTDREAQNRLARALAAQPPHGMASLADDLTAVDALVRNPPRELRESLLDDLLAPEHVGCGHLRLLLEEPTAYRARVEITRAVLRSFFRLMWTGDPRLVFETLDGQHEECAVALIHTDVPDEAADPPVIAPCPAHGPLQLFIHHPDAVAWLQDRHAEFLAREGLVPSEGVAAHIELEKALGQHHMETTLQRLAAGLPVFDVHVELGDDDAPTQVRVLRANKT